MFPENLRRIDPPAHIVANNQINGINAVQIQPERRHLAGTAADKNLFPVQQQFLHLTEKSRSIALKILGTPQTFQVRRIVRQKMVNMKIPGINGAADISSRLKNLIRQQGKGAAAGTVQTYRQVLIHHSIIFRFERSGFLLNFQIQFGADLLAEMAINAFRRINLRIPESFLICLERDRPFRADITASLAAGTVFFSFQINHNR